MEVVGLSSSFWILEFLEFCSIPKNGNWNETDGTPATRAVGHVAWSREDEYSTCDHLLLAPLLFLV